MTLVKCVECNTNEFEKCRTRKYCDECKLKIGRERCKTYKANNRDKVKEYNKASKELNKEANKIQVKIWSEQNRDIINEKQNVYLSERRKSDVIFKLNSQFRISLRKIIGGKTIESLVKLLNFDAATLKLWLEFQFDSEMTFDNHGTYWHIDHVIPSARFNVEVHEQLAICTHWTNIQPLKAEVNVSKRHTISLREIHLHEIKIHSFMKQNQSLLDVNLNRYEHYKMVINNH